MRNNTNEISTKTVEKRVRDNQKGYKRNFKKELKETINYYVNKFNEE